jgi:hypothetical protein
MLVESPCDVQQTFMILRIMRPAIFPRIQFIFRYPIKGSTFNRRATWSTCGWIVCHGEVQCRDEKRRRINDGELARNKEVISINYDLFMVNTMPCIHTTGVHCDRMSCKSLPCPRLIKNSDRCSVLTMGHPKDTVTVGCVNRPKSVVGVLLILTSLLTMC